MDLSCVVTSNQRLQAILMKVLNTASELKPRLTGCVMKQRKNVKCSDAAETQKNELTKSLSSEASTSYERTEQQLLFRPVATSCSLSPSCCCCCFAAVVVENRGAVRSVQPSADMFVRNKRIPCVKAFSISCSSHEHNANAPMLLRRFLTCVLQL